MDHVEIDDPADATLWRFDRAFLTSNWTCIWGNGCHGIDEVKAAHLGRGCCSVGAELDGADEARMVAASAAALRPELFEHHADAATGGVFADASRSSTRVVDGACIFLNRPGFSGGAGCALHIAADVVGERPIDWKPSVCWQLPIKVDWESRPDGTEVATVRGWQRRDWGAEGESMAWWCTERGGDRGDRAQDEQGEAFVGHEPVFESLGVELEEMVGTPVYVELRRRLDSSGGA